MIVHLIAFAIVCLCKKTLIRTFVLDIYPAATTWDQSVQLKFSLQGEKKSSLEFDANLINYTFVLKQEKKGT